MHDQHVCACVCVCIWLRSSLCCCRLLLLSLPCDLGREWHKNWNPNMHISCFPLPLPHRPSFTHTHTQWENLPPSAVIVSPHALGIRDKSAYAWIHKLYMDVCLSICPVYKTIFSPTKEGRNCRQFLCALRILLGWLHYARVTPKIDTQTIWNLSDI